MLSSLSATNVSPFATPESVPSPQILRLIHPNFYGLRCCSLQATVFVVHTGRHSCDYNTRAKTSTDNHLIQYRESPTCCVWVQREFFVVHNHPNTADLRTATPTPSALDLKNSKADTCKCRTQACWTPEQTIETGNSWFSCSPHVTCHLKLLVYKNDDLFLAYTATKDRWITRSQQEAC